MLKVYVICRSIRIQYPPFPLPGKPWMSVHHFGPGSVEFDHNLKPGMGQNFAHLTGMIHLFRREFSGRFFIKNSNPHPFPSSQPPPLPPSPYPAAPACFTLIATSYMDFHLSSQGVCCRQLGSKAVRGDWRGK